MSGGGDGDRARTGAVLSVDPSATATHDLNHSFLPVAEASRVLGLNRLRVREAVARGLLPARRDNRGHLRIDVEAAPADLATKLGGGAPAGVIDGLFDEIDELSDLLAEREGEVRRTTDLATRQDEALGRAVALIEGRVAPAAPTGSEDRLERALAMLDRSVGQLEAARSENARLTGLIDRALETTGRMEAELVERDAALREREAALERLLALAEREIGGREGQAAREVERERIGFWGRLTGRGRGGMKAATGRA